LYLYCPDRVSLFAGPLRPSSSSSSALTAFLSRSTFLFFLLVAMLPFLRRSLLLFTGNYSNSFVRISSCPFFHAAVFGSFLWGKLPSFVPPEFSSRVRPTVLITKSLSFDFYASFLLFSSPAEPGHDPGDVTLSQLTGSFMPCLLTFPESSGFCCAFGH